ncbi:MAG: hypothetical protein IPQ28_09610 [Sphingobacteriales bacterium]|nr:hypothetical protein [Sphingobacteriales bacterium]
MPTWAIAGNLYSLGARRNAISCKGISTSYNSNCQGTNSRAPTRCHSYPLCANSLYPTLSATGSGGSFTWYNAGPSHLGTPIHPGSGVVLTVRSL